MMNPSRRKASAFLMAAGLAYAGAFAWKPTIRLADEKPALDLENLVPRSFGEWRVDDQLPVQIISPDQAALLNKLYNQTLSRTYRNSVGDRIMLSIAYGGDQSDATRAHRPEVCYPAQGFQVLDSQVGSIPVSTGPLMVRKLVTRLGARNEPVTYWTLVGDRITLSGTQQKLAQLSYSTRGRIPDGILVRVSSIDVDSAKAFQLQARYVSALADALAPSAAPRLFGNRTS